MEVRQIGNFLTGGSWDNPQCGRVLFRRWNCTNDNHLWGGNREPKILEIKERKENIADRN